MSFRTPKADAQSAILMREVTQMRTELADLARKVSSIGDAMLTLANLFQQMIARQDEHDTTTQILVQAAQAARLDAQQAAREASAVREALDELLRATRRERATDPDMQTVPE